MVYIVRCGECGTAIGVVNDPSQMENELKQVQQIVHDIQAKVMYLK